ncbi:hypothetical protein BMF94_1892 [Rhodotorula taiwanensis]|uniref:Dienelactone hydrolase domain-containing protein n=1 Tax=Rhodotorula taiwanensis TaxID=741276 RepID=A0A2S5BDQ8_9BASI|nr:hypothetical protein BMF94_1892 [Rhodotorula taiwanensis]
MSLGQCCASGFKHDGTPSGKTEDINGVKTCQWRNPSRGEKRLKLTSKCSLTTTTTTTTHSDISLPKGDYEKSKALLFLTDIFGVNLPNGQLLADSFAENGIAVYMPDYLHDDAISFEDMNSGKVDLMAWLAKHGKDVTRPAIDKVVQHLKGQGVQKFAAIGYCFGGRYVTDLVVDSTASVGVVAHPSLLDVPKDIHDLNNSSGHFLWLNAGDDYMFNKEKQDEAREIIKGNDKQKMVDYEGVGHGFAIRGDPKDDKVRKAADDAFVQSVNFIKANL